MYAIVCIYINITDLWLPVVPGPVLQWHASPGVESARRPLPGDPWGLPMSPVVPGLSWVMGNLVELSLKGYLNEI